MVQPSARMNKITTQLSSCECVSDIDLIIVYICRYATVQAFRYTGMQTCKHEDIYRHAHAYVHIETQKGRNIDMQKCRNAEMHYTCRNAEMQKYRYANTQMCRHANVYADPHVAIHRLIRRVCHCRRKGAQSCKIAIFFCLCVFPAAFEKSMLGSSWMFCFGSSSSICV